MVAVGLSLEAKREVLEQFLPVYRDVVGTQKRVVLDDVVRLTGYRRTYASWLLKHVDEVCKIRARLACVGVQSQKDGPDETVFTILALKEHERQHENAQDGKGSALLVSEEQEPHDETNEQAGTASTDYCAKVPAHPPSFSSSFEGQGEPGSVQEPSFERAPLEPSEAKQEHVSETLLVSDS